MLVARALPVVRLADWRAVTPQGQCAGFAPVLVVSKRPDVGAEDSRGSDAAVLRHPTGGDRAGRHPIADPAACDADHVRDAGRA
jgi:hypothetical protein